MNEPAAIDAQLVDIRNIGTHKCIKLTLHVPAEYAERVMAIFGWPTAIEPIPVAIARLNAQPAERKVVQSREVPESPHQPAPSPQTTARARRSWNEMMPSEQAGLLCSDKSFQRFCAEVMHSTEMSESMARDYVLRRCEVASRRDIEPGTKAEVRWNGVVSNYRKWMQEPAV